MRCSMTRTAHRHRHAGFRRTRPALPAADPMACARSSPLCRQAAAELMLLGQYPPRPAAGEAPGARDPMDVCFSNWRALFGDAYAYIRNDFAALAQHHRTYRKLMAHWHRVHPGFVLDVPYAELVRAPEASCRPRAGFLRLRRSRRIAWTTPATAAACPLSSAQVCEPDPCARDRRMAALRRAVGTVAHVARRLNS